jgi:hypothetical protein
MSKSMRGSRASGVMPRVSMREEGCCSATFVFGTEQPVADIHPGASRNITFLIVGWPVDLRAAFRSSLAPDGALGAIDALEGLGGVLAVENLFAGAARGIDYDTPYRLELSVVGANFDATEYTATFQLEPRREDGVAYVHFTWFEVRGPAANDIRTYAQLADGPTPPPTLMPRVEVSRVVRFRRRLLGW